MKHFVFKWSSRFYSHSFRIKQMLISRLFYIFLPTASTLKTLRQALTSVDIDRIQKEYLKYHCIFTNNVVHPLYVRRYSSSSVSTATCSAEGHSFLPVVTFYGDPSGENFPFRLAAAASRRFVQRRPRSEESGAVRSKQSRRKAT